MVTAETLLEHLPPYRDEWVTIKQRQKVKDIEKRIIIAHEKFAPLYDNIALFFDAPTIGGICDNLQTFCKDNIYYIEEPDTNQTTALPTGILTRGYGDCKHFASFCGGVLDALRRLTGKKINWCYRFASYNPLSQTPGHVFIVVNNGSQKIWIDPTPGTEFLKPVWYKDKKINVSTMLTENIGSAKVGLLFGGMPITVITHSIGPNGTGSNPYLSTPFLGLSAYVEDSPFTLGTNWQSLSDQINAAIASGPMPGHTYNADFVKWVFENNIKGWNFYYYGGVPAGFDPSDQLSQLNPNYPHVIITPDGRLTFNKDVQIDDAHNNEIHAVWAHVQDLINRFDREGAAPMKPAVLKGFSQGNFGGITTGNLFVQYRGDSIFKQVGKALEDTVNFIKDVGLKIIGSIPRNAFLALVGINAFNMANALQRKINEGQWTQLSKMWKNVGGNPDKFRNTIEHGSTLPAATTMAGIGACIGVAPAVAPAWVAAAAPILAIFLKYIDKDGKITEVLSAAKGFLSTKFPDLDMDDFGFLDRTTGARVPIIIDPADDENFGGGNNDLPATTGSFSIMEFAKKNPLPTAGIGAALTYLLINKKGKKVNYVIPVVVGAGIYFLITSTGASSVESKRTALLKWNADNTTDSLETIARVKQILIMMPDSEIIATYDFVFNYATKNKPVPQGSALYNSIMAISTKYQIFT